MCPPAAGVMGPGSTAGISISLGLGLVGLGIRGRKKIFQGTPIGGRYPGLGNEGGESSRGIPVSANKKKGEQT